jgi:hypothetical protein
MQSERGPALFLVAFEEDYSKQYIIDHLGVIYGTSELNGRGIRNYCLDGRVMGTYNMIGRKIDFSSFKQGVEGLNQNQFNRCATILTGEGELTKGVLNIRKIKDPNHIPPGFKYTNPAINPILEAMQTAYQLKQLPISE